jgi:hypothetical protein
MGLPAPTPPVRDACEASELFCDDLLQDVTVQTQVRHQTLQLVVLFGKRKRPEFLSITHNSELTLVGY